MKIRTIKQIKNLKHKRVLMRVDFNVSLGDDGVLDNNKDFRLVQTLPTIRYLLRKKAKIIIMAHLGRPNGKVVKKLRLDPVANRLSQLLKKDVYKVDSVVGKEVDEFIAGMQPGEILMLENIRFDKGEIKGDKKFAKKLAQLADVYVNEAFAVSHRDHASVSTIANYLPSYGGLLLQKEIKNLSRVIERPKKPLMIIIGGAKISTKIKMIKKFLPLAKNILLGGALANTVLKVMGVGIGRSPIEPKMAPEIKKIRLTDNQVRVPIDGLMATKFEAKKGRLSAIAKVRKNEMVLDIGPDTIDLYAKILKSAKMIVWNGPMGLIENPIFAKGTEQIAKLLSEVEAKVIIGGGETVQSVRRLGLENKFYFISTGGGAMIEFLGGNSLPGLKKITSVK